jgi:ribose transport system permease protein
MTSVDRDRLVEQGSGLHEPQGLPERGRGPSYRSRVSAAADQYAGVLVVLALACVLLAVTQEQFLTTANAINVLETNAVLLVVAVGLTFVLLVGGIDLSIGGTMALSAVLLWELAVRRSLPVPLAVVIVVSAAFVLGFCVNGLLIGRVGLSFLVVTIGTASLYRGIAQVRTGGQSQSLYEQTALIEFGSARWLGLPVTVWIAVTVLLLGMLVLRHTGYGRMVYVTGGNPEAARMSGINTALVRVSVFGIAGGLAGLAAVMDASRLTAASPSAATGIELTAGAAVLLGGTSFMGGRGTLLGTLLGVLFLGVLQNGLTLSGTSPFWSGIVSGAVLIAAIFVDRLRNGAAQP